MTFYQPIWLYLLPLVLVGFWLLFFFSERVNRRLMKRFAAPKLLPLLLASYSVKRKRVKEMLFMVGITLLFFALARPQWGEEWRRVEARGIDILFALDTSKSMLARDVKPNRLERAKLAIFDILPSLEGNRLGLVVFAGEAFLQCPLTLDIEAFRQSLQAVDTSLMTRGGTDLAKAVVVAERAFVEESPQKIVLLITDGEDLEAEGISQAKKATERGVTFYTVGVGTPEGEIIPVQEGEGGIDYLRDASGRVVKSCLDEETLSQIAKITGGCYVPLGFSGEGLTFLQKKFLGKIAGKELDSRSQKVKKERYQGFLMVALLLFVVEILMGTRKSAVSTKVVGLFFAGFFFLATPLSASISEGNALYREGKYAEASACYQNLLLKNPEEARLHYNLGNSFYRTGHFEEAISSFEKALRTEELGWQKNSFYNMGNACYRRGEGLLSENSKGTCEWWERAIREYENVLALDPKDEDAAYNRDFVKKRLEELKEQMKQEPPPEEQESSSEEQKSPSEEQEAPSKKEEQNPEERGSPKESQEAEEKKASGAMTRMEAAQLLEALKGEEQAMPVYEASGDEPSQEATYRDW